MVERVINGQLIKVHDSWDTVSTGLYEELDDKWDRKDTPESILNLFCLLCEPRLDPYKIERLTEQADLFVNHCVRFAYEDALPLELPKDYTGPMNLHEVMIGQNLQVRQAIRNGKPGTRLSFIIATYMQPVIDGHFNSKRVKDIELLYKAEPIVETYPLGFFLWSLLLKSGARQMSIANQIQQTILVYCYKMKLQNLLKLVCLNPIRTRAIQNNMLSSFILSLIGFIIM